MRVNLPEGYTPVIYDIVKNVWILRNQERQAESLEVRPYSVQTIEYRTLWGSAKAARWTA